MKKTKFKTTPYFGRFACKGSLCEENCCIGWEIDIDPRTLSRYSSVEGDFAKRLVDGIVKEGNVSHFVMKNGRCPFLNHENLCDIIIGLGDGMLCEICREHPRFYTVVGDVTYGGVGLSCEAAAELILTDGDVFGYIDAPERSLSREDSDADTLDGCDADALINEAICEVDRILRECREDVPRALRKIISGVRKYGGRLDELLFGECVPGEDETCSVECGSEEGELRLSDSNAEKYLAEAKSALLSLEYLTDELPERIKSLMCADVSDFYRKKPKNLGYAYRLLAYFCDRHIIGFMNECDTEGALCTVLYLTLAALMLQASSGDGSLESAVRSSTLLSREIEYNEENIAALASCECGVGADELYCLITHLLK